MIEKIAIIKFGLTVRITEMIKWLTVGINPPELDTEIIVKSTIKENFGYKGIYCELKFYDSETYSQQEMIDDLGYEKWDLWSSTE